MPDAKNNAKLTGDTHLPDVESDLPLEGASDNPPGEPGSSAERGRGSELGMEGKPSRGHKHAGELKDKDAETSDSYGNTRDSGEKPKP